MKRTFPFVLFTLVALSLAACGRNDIEPVSQGNAAAGENLFTTCTACHGATGEGVSSLGPNLTTDQFVANKTDAELVEFIKVGRDANDPLNTTGITMPPKGSNPGLSEQDLYDIVAYLRSIQK